MGTVVAAVRQVEIVGGESWWNHNAGSLVVGLAAIVAASLAAYVSIRNHKQQLTHDREIRDRDAIRDAIDSAVQGISTCVLRGVTFSGSIATLEQAREKLKGADRDNSEVLAKRQREVTASLSAVTEATTPLYTAINAMHADTIRLSVRLGKEHPVAVEQAKTRDALSEWTAALDKGRDQDRTDNEKKATKEAMGKVRKVRTRFEDACHTWLTG